RYVLAADGASYLFETDGKLATIRWNGRDFEELSARGDAGSMSLARDGKRVYLLSRNGAPASLAASGRDWETPDLRARLAINLAAERAQKFDDAARTMGLVFYHPDMKGLDWEALSARYRELALDTRLASEFNEVFNRLLGELNASHLGMWGGQ